MAARRPPARRARARVRTRRRLPRLTIRRLAAGLVLLVAFLYYRPLTTYFQTRAEVRQRAAEVQSLRAQRQALRGQFGPTTSQLTLAREARQLSLVRPGERLYVLTGLERWRRAHAHR